MTIDVNWHDDAKRILVLSFHPDTGWEEFKQVLTASFDSIRALKHSVVMIHNWEATKPNLSDSSAAELLAVLRNTPINLVLTISVGISGLAISLGSLVVRLARLPVDVTPTMDDALKLAHDKLGIQFANAEH
ncbi:MAG: hypothetical protein GYB68_04445 [Chloroflexi bacterium]|nr:hypothetical protein [Chloroflexota bacterium]